MTSSEPAGIDVEHGLPRDRTICPNCFGRALATGRCHVCGGEPVCPKCRGANVVRTEDGLVRPCAGCQVWSGEFVALSMPGAQWPVSLRDDQKMRRTISDYLYHQQWMNEGPTDDVPF
jgi:hypothetical protein